jgi:hypothetical protein
VSTVVSNHKTLWTVVQFLKANGTVRLDGIHFTYLPVFFTIYQLNGQTKTTRVAMPVTYSETLAHSADSTIGTMEDTIGIVLPVQGAFQADILRKGDLASLALFGWFLFEPTLGASNLGNLGPIQRSVTCRSSRNGGCLVVLFVTSKTSKVSLAAGCKDLASILTVYAALCHLSIV